MNKPKICHRQNNDFLDALDSCLQSGLSLWLDGVPQTKEELLQTLLLKEHAVWEGDFLENEDGELKGLSFTDTAVR